VVGPLGAAEAAVRVGGHQVEAEAAARADGHQVEVAVGPKEDGLPVGVGRNTIISHQNIRRLIFLMHFQEEAAAVAEAGRQRVVAVTRAGGRAVELLAVEVLDSCGISC
jgi:hypothetical protein